MRRYDVKLKIDVSSDVTPDNLKEWLRDALGPAATVMDVRLVAESRPPGLFDPLPEPPPESPHG